MRYAGRLIVLFFAAGPWAGGFEVARYCHGVEGIKCGSAPPPGYYLRSYNLWYHSTDLKDQHGKDVDVGFNLDVVVSAERFIWVTDAPKKELGFDFGVYAIVPFMYSSHEMRALGVDDPRLRVGDVEVSPAMLAWHFPRVDLTLAYEFIAPTGDYHRGEAATMCVGYDYWTHQPTLGVTGYLDSEKTWTISLLPRYEFHMERKNAHYRAGDQFHFEWGVAKALPKIGLEVGLTGYCSWQTTDDKGKGVTWDRKVHDRVYAVGPEVAYFIKPIELNMSVRYQREFGARDHMEGQRTTLMFTKRF
jgi:hypothetical protein